jgi:hypothetical protein
MPKFKIKDKQTVFQVTEYFVEADTAEEALDKYVNELAGTLPVHNEYISEHGEEGITVE